MTDLNDQITTHVNNFIDAVRNAVYLAAIDLIRRDDVAAIASASASVAATKTPRDRVRARVAAAIEEVGLQAKADFHPHPLPSTQDVLLYIKRHPRARAEEISQGMAVEAPVLQPILRQLVKGGEVATEGRNRGMCYLPIARMVVSMTGLLTRQV